MKREISIPLYMQADYIDRKIEQSFKWVNGVSEHDHVYNECCRDFSCCYPDLLERDPAKRQLAHTEFFNKLIDRRKMET